MTKFFLAYFRKMSLIPRSQCCRFNVRKATPLPALFPIAVSLPLHELNLRYIIIRAPVIGKLFFSLSLDVSLFSSSFNRTAMNRALEPSYAVMRCAMSQGKKPRLVHDLWRWETRTEIISVSEKRGRNVFSKAREGGGGGGEVSPREDRRNHV